MVTWESSISNSVLVCGVLGLCLSGSIVQQGPLYYGLCWPLWAFNWLDRSSSQQLDATFKGYHAWESCGPCFATTSWFKWQIQEDINPNTAIYTNCHGFSVWCFSESTSHVTEIPRDSQGFPGIPRDSHLPTAGRMPGMRHKEAEGLCGARISPEPLALHLLTQLLRWHPAELAMEII